MIVKVIFLLIVSSAILVDGQESDKNPKIVIVGAGAAGIAAASKLHENGFQDITILEAEPRLGGRIETVNFGEYVVDLGAETVNGQKGNSAYELAEPLGLVEVPTEDDDSLYMIQSNGQRVSDEINNKFGETFMLLWAGDPNKTDVSVGEYFRRGFNQMFKESPEINEELQKELLEAAEKLELVASEAADTWDQCSIKSYTDYDDGEGMQNVNWKDRGYSTILDVLMKKIPNRAEELPIESKYLKLNSPVTQINYDGKLKGAEITTKDGNKIQADHVIVTVSLGVLKEKKDSLFTPALSEKKIKTIDNLGFGNFGKILMSFDAPAFIKEQQTNSTMELGYGFVWKEADKQKLIESSPEKKWLLDVFGLFTTSRRPKLAMFWVASQGARDSEQLSDETLKEHLTELFQKFLGSETSAKPKEVIRTKWYSNENFKGVYSYRSLKSESENASAEDLEEPIMKNGKPVILFAGEATSETKYASVHGAITSGWREADRITEMYKSKA